MTTQWMFWGAFQILIYVQVHPSGFLCVRFVCLSTGVAAHLWSEKGTPLPLMRRDQLRASGPITSSRDCVCSMLIYNRHTWIFNDGRSVRQYQRCGHCFIYDTSISCLRAAIIEWWTKHQGRMIFEIFAPSPLNRSDDMFNTSNLQRLISIRYDWSERTYWNFVSFAKCNWNSIAYKHAQKTSACVVVATIRHIRSMNNDSPYVNVNVCKLRHSPVHSGQVWSAPMWMTAEE